MPSIVSITTKSVEEVQNYYGMFGQYGAYSPEQREVQGSGSGIIIGKNDSELLIATNYHVVEGAETLSVGFCDSTACEAKVKGYDSERDLAVVAVSLDDIDSDTMDAITIATIGNSDDLKVGAQVVAIGNALGYGQSVTTGIVSAKTVSYTHLDVYKRQRLLLQLHVMESRKSCSMRSFQRWKKPVRLMWHLRRWLLWNV